MRKIALLLSVTFLLLVSVAVADSDTSSVSISALENQIAPHEQAQFKLVIDNDHPTEAVSYSIYSFVQGWNVNPSPLKDKIITIASGGSYSTTIVAQPHESFSPGVYNLEVIVESDVGELFPRTLKVYLEPESPIDYLPTIKVNVDMDEKINPTQAVPIKLFIDNRNPLDLTDLVVKIKSDIPEFAQEAVIDIPPLQKKTVEFTVVPNEHQQPKEYPLFFVFERNGETVKVVEQEIEILPLLPAFTVDVASENIFLKKFAAAEIHNPGNVLNTQRVEVPMSFWSALFVSGADSGRAEDGSRVIFWEVTLGADESTTIHYTVNYRILLAIVVVLVVFLIFYSIVQSPLVIKKKAVTTKSHEHGALSEIKVTLEVRNKSKRGFKDVEIIDWVPAIANVEKSLELGTLRPKAVRHTKKGAKVIWALAELDAHEHRLITYKVRAKLNILGTFSLPRAVVEFHKKEGGKKSKAFSNVYRLNG